MNQPYDWEESSLGGWGRWESEFERVKGAKVTDRHLIAVFLVVGVVISLGSPILGAIVMFPACVIWVSRKIGGRDE